MRSVSETNTAFPAQLKQHCKSQSYLFLQLYCWLLVDVALVSFNLCGLALVLPLYAYTPSPFSLIPRLNAPCHVKMTATLYNEASLWKVNWASSATLFPTIEIQLCEYFFSGKYCVLLSLSAPLKIVDLILKTWKMNKSSFQLHYK